MFFGIVIIILLYITDLAKFKGAWWPGKSPQCLKLSNSGNALKLWVPQNGIKAICKWINNRFAVTILKMMETEIGNRGSKLIIVVCPSHIFVIIINEQRVYGSWWKKYKNTSHPIMLKCFFHLRCTLMDLEINYPVPSLSKQIHTSRGNSSLATHHCSLDNFQLVPNWVTGLVDGDPAGMLLRFYYSTERHQARLTRKAKFYYWFA